VHTNDGAQISIVKNPDIPEWQAPDLKHFLGFSDMEPSNKGLTNFDFFKDDCSTPSLAISHCSEEFQHDGTNDEVQSIDSKDDWEPLDPPTTFMDNVVTINVSDKPVALQEVDFFSEMLEAHLSLSRTSWRFLKMLLRTPSTVLFFCLRKLHQWNFVNQMFLYTPLNTLCVESDNVSLIWAAALVKQTLLHLKATHL